MLWYIIGIINTCIQYQHHDDGHILHEFLDVDWAGDKNTQISTSSYCFLLAGGVVSRQVKKNLNCLFLHKK